MNLDTLVAAMPGLSPDRAARFLPGANEALSRIGVDKDHLQRAWHFLSQIGHESVSLQYTEEQSSGWAYDRTNPNGPWEQLGNIYEGDGPLFKGRSFIQITGRTNYERFSQWAYEQGMVSRPHTFIANPSALAGDRFAWIGATWYWLTQRPLNEYADANDIQQVTRAINGGLNGLDDRQKRYNIVKALGDRVLPNEQEFTVDVEAKAAFTALQHQVDDINAALKLIIHGDDTHIASLEAIRSDTDAIRKTVVKAPVTPAKK